MLDGKRVRARRKELGLTHAQLADKIGTTGITATAIAGLESSGRGGSGASPGYGARSSGSR